MLDPVQLTMDILANLLGNLLMGLLMDSVTMQNPPPPPCPVEYVLAMPSNTWVCPVEVK